MINTVFLPSPHKQLEQAIRHIFNGYEWDARKMSATNHD
jgi:hypothetical protein